MAHAFPTYESASKAAGRKRETSFPLGATHNNKKVETSRKVLKKLLDTSWGGGL